MTACSVDGCDREEKKRGWCERHYNRWYRNGDPLAGGPEKASPNSLHKCVVDGCLSKAISLHLCSKHHAKYKKYGDPTGGYEQDGRSKEWHTNNVGYVIRFDPTSPHAGGNKLVYQHRQVIGELIGRPLRSNENVHHKNGNRADNRPENLELWVKSQPAGQRVQDLVAWARETLKEYGKLVDSMK